MTIPWAIFASVFAFGTALNSENVDAGTPVWVKTGDALFLAGLGATLIAAAIHWRRRGLNPFRHAQVRGCRLTPALTFAPVMVYVFTFALLGTVQSWVSQVGADGAAQQAVNSAAQLAGAVCCLWIAKQRFHGGFRGFFLGRQGWPRALLAAPVYFLAASSLCDFTYIGTGQAFRLLWPDYEFFQHRVIQALRTPGEPFWAPALLWIGATLVAPVAEEGFFRGFLQSLVLRATHKRGLAVFAAAAAFAVAHADQPHVLPAMMVFGLVIGLQYERTGGLVGPIAVHALFNLKTLIWEWWSRAPT